MAAVPFPSSSHPCCKVTVRHFRMATIYDDGEKGVGLPFASDWMSWFSPASYLRRHDMVNLLCFDNQLDYNSRLLFYFGFFFSSSVFFYEIFSMVFIFQKKRSDDNNKRKSRKVNGDICAYWKAYWKTGIKVSLIHASEDATVYIRQTSLVFIKTLTHPQCYF